MFTENVYFLSYTKLLFGIFLNYFRPKELLMVFIILYINMFHQMKIPSLFVLCKRENLTVKFSLQGQWHPDSSKKCTLSFLYYLSSVKRNLYQWPERQRADLDIQNLPIVFSTRAGIEREIFSQILKARWETKQICLFPK